MDFTLLVAVGIVSGLSSYFGTYLNKKGENRAIREDIRGLVEQVSAVTKATRAIEAEISAGVWDRQKQWEMKREVLFGAARRLSEADEAMLGYAVVMRQDQANRKIWESGGEPPVEERLEWLQRKGKRMRRWSKASAAFDETRVFVAIVCKTETREAFDELGRFINQLATDVSKDAGAYEKLREDLIKKQFAARLAIRKELGINNRS